MPVNRGEAMAKLRAPTQTQQSRIREKLADGTLREISGARRPSRPPGRYR